MIEVLNGNAKPVSHSQLFQAACPSGGAGCVCVCVCGGGGGGGT